MSLRVAIIRDEKLCMLIRVSGMKEHIASVLSLYVATIEKVRLYCRFTWAIRGMNQQERAHFGYNEND